MDHIQKGTEAMLAKVKDKKLTKKLHGQKLIDDIESLRKTMVVTTGDNYVATAEPQLREKISAVYGEVVNYAGRPSNAQIENMNLLNQKLNECKKQVAEMVSRSENINAILSKLKIDHIISYRSKQDFMLAD